MKRKIAFLLAVVMTFGMLSVNAFATTTGYTEVNIYGAKPHSADGGILYEWNVLTNVGADSGWYRNSDKDLYYQDTAAYLEIIVGSRSLVKNDAEFTVYLDGADWLFQDTSNDYTNVIVDATYGRATYNTSFGTYLGGRYGTYKRNSTAATAAINAANAGDLQEVAYDLVLNRIDKSRADIKLTGDGSAYLAEDDVIRIPLVGAMNTDGVVYARLVGTSTGGVPSGRYAASFETEVGAVRITVGDPTTGKNNFVLPKISLIERSSRIMNGTNFRNVAAGGATYTLVPDGYDANGNIIYKLVTTAAATEGKYYEPTAYIEAPDGYDFVPTYLTKITITGGLRWDGAPNVVLGGVVGSSLFSDVVTGTSDSDSFVGGNVPILRAITGATSGKEGRGVLQINLGLLSSEYSTLPGTVTIEGLQIAARSDDTDYGDTDGVRKVRVYDGSYGVLFNKVKSDDSYWHVATNKEEDVYFNRISEEAPTLWTGAGYQAAATVEFGESVRRSWWAERQTTFELSDGAMFESVSFPADVNTVSSGFSKLNDRRIRVVGAADGGIKDSTGKVVTGTYGEYSEGQFATGLVTLTTDRLTLQNMTIDTNKAAKIRMTPRIWLRGGLEVETDGAPVTMTAKGYSYDTLYPDFEIALEIAIPKDKIKVTVDEVAKLNRLGYQIQPTSDVTIEEAEKGILGSGTELYVSLTDPYKASVLANFVSLVVQDTKAYTLSGNAELGALKRAASSVTIPVKYKSTQVSTLQLTNLGALVSTVAPLSTHYEYELSVYGNAFVEPTNPFLEDNAITVKYVEVVNEAGDTDVNNTTGVDIYASAKFNEYLEFIVGAEIYIMDGVEYPTGDVYLDKLDTNSFFVPTRLAAEAFGLEGEKLVWTDARKTTGKEFVNFTTFDGKQVRFTVEENKTDDSFFYLVDGVPVPMTNEEGDQLACIRQGEFILVPVRILGDLFGYDVEWVQPAADGSGEGFRYVR